MSLADARGENRGDTNISKISSERSSHGMTSETHDDTIDAPVIQLIGVSKVFAGAPPGALPALDTLYADIPARQVIGLVGPDAAGKTTLMRLLAGLLLPSAGEVLVWGRVPGVSDSSRQADSFARANGGDVGYMPQRFGLYEDLSVIDNLNLHAELRGLEGSARIDMFEKLLTFTALKPFTTRLAGKLSGGMKQKLGLACALLTTPRLLLLDEPGVGVDPLSRRELWSMVSGLAGDGMSVLWSTAYMDEAERCAHVLMLDQGKLVYQGPPAAFMQRVEGRVFCLVPPPGTAREALAFWQQQPGVRDALIQGSRIRLVLETPSFPSLAEHPDCSFFPVPPRLEDAYIDAVGGMNPEPSPFLQQHPFPISLSPSSLSFPAPLLPSSPLPDSPSFPASLLPSSPLPDSPIRPESPPCAESHSPAPVEFSLRVESSEPDTASEGAFSQGCTVRVFPEHASQENAPTDACAGVWGGAPPPACREASPVIRAVGLTKQFGSFVAARDISFEVLPGRIFGLLGPNGAGKSTTFRMLCGLSKPTKGECFVAGMNLLTAAGAARARLGYMAQKFSLYGELTVLQNMRLMADLYDLPRKQMQERMDELVAALDLTSFRTIKANLLPLGHKQRLAMACATLHNPSVLFLDEPTSGVDPRTRREFWKHINAMTRNGVAVLVTTHFMEEAEYCDEIALVFQGAIIARGTPDALKAQCPTTSDTTNITLEEAFIAYIEHVHLTDTGGGV